MKEKQRDRKNVYGDLFTWAKWRNSFICIHLQIHAHIHYHFQIFRVGVGAADVMLLQFLLRLFPFSTDCVDLPGAAKDNEYLYASRFQLNRSETMGQNRKSCKCSIFKL